MVMSALAALLSLRSPRVVLGYVATVSGEVTIHRSDGHPSQVVDRAMLQAGKRVELGSGDVVEVPKNAGVKGIYDSKTLLLFGPRQWRAPEPGAFDGKPAAAKILGQRGMGDPPRHLAASVVFAVLAPSRRDVRDFYVERDGAFRLAWVASEEVRSVTLVARVEGKTLGPFRYPAHRADSPNPSIGWVEDGELGLALRRDHMSEADKTPCALTLTPDKGAPVTLALVLISKAEARDLDPGFELLRTSLSAPDTRTDDDWFGTWNDCLVVSQDELPASNAFWVVRAWSFFPNLFVTRDAMRQLLEESRRTR